MIRWNRGGAWALTQDDSPPTKMSPTKLVRPLKFRPDQLLRELDTFLDRSRRALHAQIVSFPKFENFLWKIFRQSLKSEKFRNFANFEFEVVFKRLRGYQTRWLRFRHSFLLILQEKSTKHQIYEFVNNRDLAVSLTIPNQSEAELVVEMVG